MRIRLEGGLPFVSVSLTRNGKTLKLDQVLLDTGSGASVFSADELLGLGVRAEPEDRVLQVAGVGGSEFVFSKRLDLVALEEMEVSEFEIQVGAMDYGFFIQGILGMDFMLKVGAVVDLARLEIRRADLPLHDEETR